MSALAIVLIRLMGVWLIVVQAAPSVPWAVLSVLHPNDYSGPLAARIAEASLMVLPAVLGLAVIVTAPKIARAVCAGASGEPTPAQVDLMRVGTALLGLYVVVYALPVLASPFAAFAVEASRNHGASVDLGMFLAEPEIGWAAIELLLGAALLLYARRS